MKIIVCFCLFVSIAFSSNVLNTKLKDCSKIDNTQLRLNCYDKLAFSLSPSEKFVSNGKKLVKECKYCHGSFWDISTNGERFVKDMTEEEILNALVAYKLKKRDSKIMYFHISKYSQEELELISKYINYEILVDAF